MTRRRCGPMVLLVAVAAGSGCWLLPEGGGVHAEAGRYSHDAEFVSDSYEDAVYFGVRYSKLMALWLSCSLSAGYYNAAPKSGVTAEDLEVFPVTLTLELGSQVPMSQSRWFVGGGGGYFMTEARDAVPLLGVPAIDSEWGTHAVAGFEFRNETSVITRVQGGYTWLRESEADMWTLSAALGYQF